MQPGTIIEETTPLVAKFDKKKDQKGREEKTINTSVRVNHSVDTVPKEKYTALQQANA